MQEKRTTESIPYTERSPQRTALNEQRDTKEGTQIRPCRSLAANGPRCCKWYRSRITTRTTSHRTFRASSNTRSRPCGAAVSDHHNVVPSTATSHNLNKTAQIIRKNICRGAILMRRSVPNEPGSMSFEPVSNQESPGMCKALSRTHLAALLRNGSQRNSLPPH